MGTFCQSSSATALVAKCWSKNYTPNSDREDYE